jgi:hypothetical protein
MLLDLLMGEGLQSAAVIGLSKNAGKTTVFNALIMEAKERSIRVGLVSIGVDGEERDVWSLQKKPPVKVPRGCLVATAGPLLEDRAGEWELLDSTSVHSPLGPVVIARALKPTEVKLAGITRVESLREAQARLQQNGAALVLADGAYDRKAAACPLVTDGAICVAGAALSPSLDTVIRRMEETIRLFQLPQTTESLWRSAGERALAEGRVYGVAEGEIVSLPISSLLAAPSTWQKLLREREWECWAIPGMATDRLLQKVEEAGRPLPLVLTDPTRCFASMSALRGYFRKGGSLQVLYGVKLVAVAVNPVSPEGYGFDPVEMKRRVSKVCHPVPVVDVVRDVG